MHDEQKTWPHLEMETKWRPSLSRSTLVSRQTGQVTPFSKSAAAAAVAPVAAAAPAAAAAALVTAEVVAAVVVATPAEVEA